MNKKEREIFASQFLSVLEGSLFEDMDVEYDELENEMEKVLEMALAKVRANKEK